MALRKCPKCELNYLKPGETICYSYMKLQGNQSTIDDFIKEMEYISPTPDDTASCNAEATTAPAAADEIEDM